MAILLTREEFRRLVFERDHSKCVMCGQFAIDAHHIIDRSLFEDNGYHIDNGVSLCKEHHLYAEQTTISCKVLRLKAKIKTIILPEHLDPNEEYDHWGNIVKPNGTRLRGDLFFEENVQKALREGDVLHFFVPYVKYPRTYHLPDSPNLQNDDRQHEDVSFFNEKNVVGLIKVDGENTNMYPDYIHARSIDFANHCSRTWVKALHGQIAHEIPLGYRICGENLYAKHSIHYKHLKSFFYAFSIWNERNVALSWDETVEYSELLGLCTVPIFYRGVWNRALIQEKFEDYCKTSLDPVEGFVVRIADKIPYYKFRLSTAKYVRKNHVTTDEFWLNQEMIPNVLDSTR